MFTSVIALTDQSTEVLRKTENHLLNPFKLFRYENNLLLYQQSDKRNFTGICYHGPYCSVLHDLLSRPKGPPFCETNAVLNPLLKLFGYENDLLLHQQSDKRNTFSISYYGPYCGVLCCVLSKRGSKHWLKAVNSNSSNSYSSKTHSKRGRNQPVSAASTAGSHHPCENRKVNFKTFLKQAFRL